MKPTVSLTPEQVSVEEGNTFVWNFSLDNPVPEGGLTIGNTDQIVSLSLENVFLPVQGGVVSDTTIIIDQKDGLESFPDIVPLATFVEDFLNNYPNPDDFFQNISNNLSQAILDNQDLGFAGTVDSLKVNLERQPAGIVPFEFSSEATNTPGELSDQVVSFNLQDILVPVQGGTVADTTITIDQIDGLQTFPDIIPVANFAREFLSTYPNPNDFYQTISQNLSQAILNNQDLGFSDNVDSISVKLDREPAGIVPFEFSSEAISTPEDTISHNEISGTPQDDNLIGSNATEKIKGGRGDDDIFANGGMDTLIGGRGDDNIYGTNAAEKIKGGRGDDNIYANGGSDWIDSGFGFDNVFLGAGEAIVILETEIGFDKIFNFQLGTTNFQVSSLDNLTFADSSNGVEIFQDNDLIAVVAGQSANTFSSNQDMIFSV